MSQISNMLAFRRDPFAFIGSLYSMEADKPLTVFELPLGRQGAVLRDPEMVWTVLQQKNGAFEKPPTGNAISHQILGGPSVLTYEGSPHEGRRKLLNPPFMAGSIEEMFGDIFLSQAQHFIEELEASQSISEPWDVVPPLQRLTMRIAITSMFPQKTIQPEDIEAVRTGVSAVDKHFLDEFALPFPLPIWLPTPTRKVFAQRTAAMREIIRRIIESERSQSTSADTNKAGGFSLPARLIQAGLTNQQCESELLAVLMAGYQTTALSTAWGLYLLAMYPHVQEELAALLQKTTSVGEIVQLPLLKGVVDETLRLFPSIWMTFRSPTAQTMLGQVTLAKGTMLVISPYFLHRDSRIWPDPAEFRPDRFSSTPPRGAYTPFIWGPHVCLGKHFALLEMLVVLAVLCQHLSFRPLPGYEPAPMFRSLITPREGIILRCEHRSRINSSENWR